MARRMAGFTSALAILILTGLLTVTGHAAQSLAAQATAAPTLAATAAPTAAATESALAPDEQEVTFKVGDDTIYGTLLIPANATGKLPAVLLLSGSGPTDRDGNTPLIQGKVDSHKHFARVLADAGVASLRYDKLASGKTGLGTYATHLNDMGFDLYVQQAITAYSLLKSRPEVDPTRIAILGHSEGGLIALVAADQLKASGPKALILAAPLSRSYLVTVREQIGSQYAAAVKAGNVSQADADKSLAELDDIIKTLLTTGKLPDKINPPYDHIFNPSVAKFLAEAGRYDPADIAAKLPPTLPVLVMCGEKDIQVPCADVEHLMEGFAKGGNKNASLHTLANVIHVFKEIDGPLNPNPLVDYADPTKPFSKEAAQLITDFVKAKL